MNNQLPIIFLDFDGVLNSQLFYKRMIQETGKRQSRDLDEIAIGYLNGLTEAGAKVVVSSTWRHGRSMEKLQEILEQFGFKGEVIGRTPHLRIGEDGDCILRGNEILSWIKDSKHIVGAEYHEYKRYVIFDDDSDMLYWQRNNFLWCDPYVGLTPNLVWKAKKILQLPENLAEKTEIG